MELICAEFILFLDFRSFHSLFSYFIPMELYLAQSSKLEKFIVTVYSDSFIKFFTGGGTIQWIIGSQPPKTLIHCDGFDADP